MILVLRRILVILILSAIFTSAASADVIYLKTGGKISGKVVKESVDTVTIDIGGGTVVQNKSDIVRIKTEEEALQPKEMALPEVLEEESATPMLDTSKNKKGPFGIVAGVVDTAFSILKFDFLKKDK